MDVAPWCYKWDWMDWISPGGVRYRAPYGANKFYDKAFLYPFLRSWVSLFVCLFIYGFVPKLL